MSVENLKNELSSLHLLKHPFYTKWSAGELSIQTLRDYAAQYYHHVDAFPRYISSIHTQCPDIKTRQVLLDNLMDEEMGDDNHPDLWLRFGEELGVSRDSIKNANLNDETKSLVDGFFNLCKQSFATGMGALFAYEQQVPEIAKSKIDGLKKFYNISSEKGLKFFNVHIGADEWHSQECQDIIDNLPTDQKEEARNGALEAAKLLWNFLSGVERVSAVN